MSENRLSVSEYDSLESSRKIDICLEKIQAYFPTLFAERGFPIRVSNSGELWKYADVMQNQRFTNNINLGLGGKINKDEFDLLKSLTENVVKVTSSLGTLSLGRNVVSRSLIMSRVLTELKNANILEKKLNILELGGGCGYQASVFQLRGDNVFLMDNTQAFYLFQNNFYENICPEKFLELAKYPIEEANDLLSRFKSTDNTITHFPWWLFVNDKLLLPKVDVVIANHMLSEMNPRAFKYAFAKLATSNKRHGVANPVVIFETWGGDFERIPGVMSDFISLGYFPVHNAPLYMDNIGRDFSVSVFRSNISLIEGGVDYKLKAGNEIVEKKLKQLSALERKLNYSELLQLFRTNLRFFERELLISTSDDFSRNIINMRNTLNDYEISLDLINEYYQKYVSGSNIKSFLTDDERFEHICGRKIEKDIGVDD